MPRKIIALLVCVVILGVTAVTLHATPVKQGKPVIVSLFEKSWNLLISIFPSLQRAPQVQDPVQGQPEGSATKIVKPLDQGAPAPRPSTRD